MIKVKTKSGRLVPLRRVRLEQAILASIEWNLRECYHGLYPTSSCSEPMDEYKQTNELLQPPEFTNQGERR